MTSTQGCHELDFTVDAIQAVPEDVRALRKKDPDEKKYASLLDSGIYRDTDVMKALLWVLHKSFRETNICHIYQGRYAKSCENVRDVKDRERQHNGSWECNEVDDAMQYQVVRRVLGYLWMCR